MTIIQKKKKVLLSLPNYTGTSVVTQHNSLLLLVLHLSKHHWYCSTTIQCDGKKQILRRGGSWKTCVVCNLMQHFLGGNLAHVMCVFFPFILQP